ncbi:hypothetical protein Bbelb_177400 [Branchiostoma belcheri]|nr:hypothetical protein Bbelb_177400 [Branchiostoma belcheri]
MFEPKFHATLGAMSNSHHAPLLMRQGSTTYRGVGGARLQQMSAPVMVSPCPVLPGSTRQLCSVGGPDNEKAAHKDTCPAEHAHVNSHISYQIPLKRLRPSPISGPLALCPQISLVSAPNAARYFQNRRLPMRCVLNPVAVQVCTCRDRSVPGVYICTRCIYLYQVYLYQVYLYQVYLYQVRLYQVCMHQVRLYQVCMYQVPCSIPPSLLFQVVVRVSCQPDLSPRRWVAHPGQTGPFLRPSCAVIDVVQPSPRAFPGLNTFADVLYLPSPGPTSATNFPLRVEIVAFIRIFARCWYDVIWTLTRRTFSVPTWSFPVLFGRLPYVTYPMAKKIFTLFSNVVPERSNPTCMHGTGPDGTKTSECGTKDGYKLGGTE